MTSDPVAAPERRTQRTRAAIRGALMTLIFTRRYGSIRTGELIEAAGIGRSTFYEHFRSKDDVLVAIIDPIFVPLAAGATGRGSRPALEVMLTHLWTQRARARMLFEAPLTARLQTKLAAMIEVRLAPRQDAASPALLAVGAAARQMAMLRMWLIGEAACSVSAMADQLLTRLESAEPLSPPRPHRHSPPAAAPSPSGH